MQSKKPSQGSPWTQTPELIEGRKKAFATVRSAPKA
jgi:hypothetical protein